MVFTANKSYLFGQFKHPGELCFLSKIKPCYETIGREALL